MVAPSLHQNTRGISLLQKTYEIFSEQKDLQGFLMDLYRKQKIFANGERDFLGVPLGRRSHNLERIEIYDILRNTENT